MPKEAGKYPSFYGTLRLRLSYADGKSAGTKDTWICLQNKPVTGTPLLEAKVLTVSETSASRYLVTGSFQNTGETHAASLTCQGVLSIVGGGGLGSAVYKRFLMTCEAVGQTGILLPFEIAHLLGHPGYLGCAAGRLLRDERSEVARRSGGRGAGAARDPGLRTRWTQGRPHDYGGGCTDRHQDDVADRRGGFCLKQGAGLPIQVSGREKTCSRPRKGT